MVYTTSGKEKHELSELVHLFLDIGEAICLAGGEIFRVEDTISRLGLAYGATRCDVFAITSHIELTIAFGGDVEITRSRRLRGGDTNLTRLEELNALSRRLCAAPLPPAELRAALAALDARAPLFYPYLGSFLGAGFFAVFFGGGVAEGAVAALVGLLICFLRRRLTPLCPNRVMVIFLTSLASATAVLLAARLFPSLSSDTVLIGDVMLLIPGFALTSSVRNIISGDMMSGILGLTESLIFATSLVGGVLLAMGLLGVA